MNTLHILLDTPLFCLFFTIALGLLLGKVSLRGISLGAAGVLFVALVVGHFGYAIPEGVGKLGLVLFIYCIGISAGGRFFSALSKHGVRSVIIAIVTMASGALILYFGQQVLDLPKDIALGLYAGAFSSAPALAAAAESIEGSGQNLIVGYGIAYPLGIIGLIISVQILPNLLYKKQIEQEIVESQAEEESLINVLVEVTNQAICGRNISDFGLKHLQGCQIARRLKGERLLPLAYEDTFEKSQHILMVGREKDLDLAIDLIGQKSSKNYVRDIENERQHVQCHNLNFVGQSLHDIATLKNYGVMVTRISRYGFTFVPKGDTVVERRDIFRVIGRPDAIRAFSKAVGHKKSSPAGMELLSLSIGISLGILLAMIPFSLPGSNSITLGLAGGPLVMALIFGHFGHIGQVVTHIRRDTRELLQSIGLAFFVADSGIQGGGGFVETFTTYGPSLLVLGLLITLGAIAATFCALAFFCKLSPLTILGTLCGSMTSTPALGSLTSKYASQIPVINYATIYPVALIVITMTMKVLTNVL